MANEMGCQCHQVDATEPINVKLDAILTKFTDDFGTSQLVEHILIVLF